ncbi:MAG: carboxymuconolactone decarboxylase family protein [Paracoccus sp. (in: a-proteobacteria)]
MTDAHLEQGRAVAEGLNPGLPGVLSDKYDTMLPGMSDSLIEWAYGHHYARHGLDLKTRQLCTVAALTALGGGTAPQLKVNIAHTLAAGASPREIVEAIWQMAVYAGMPVCRRRSTV